MKLKLENIVLFVYLLFASIILALYNNLTVFCIINILYIVLIFLTLKIDIKNPLVLFTVFFILYQISYPIVSSHGIRVFEFVELNSNYYLYSWLATISFYIFWGNASNVKYDFNKSTLNTNIFLLKTIYYFLVLVSILSSLYIIKNGFQSKYDLANSNNIILKIGDMSYTELIVFPLFILLSKNYKVTKKRILIIFNLMIMLFGMLTFGERSYVFNYVIIIALYYFTLRKISVNKMAILGIAGILFVSFSSSLKMLFANNNYSNIQYNDNIIINFLNSDFSAAGFNFNFLLNNNDKNIFLGKTYIYDFLSPLDFVLPIEKYSAPKWYTNEYWKKRRTGLGFTIIGEGFINFGLVGIIFEMLIISRILKFFYLKSNNNYYYYIVYMGLLSLSLYACRQSLASIISPTVKYHILFAVIVYFINKSYYINKKGVKDEKNFK